MASTPLPPGPPSAQPPGPPPRTEPWVVVVLSLLAAFVVFIALGVIVALHIAAHTRITEVGTGSQKSVDIESPLGDLHVHGNGDNATGDIRSPFGELHVTPVADPARLDMPLYPGSEPVTSRSQSPFHQAFNLGGRQVSHGNSTGAQVDMNSGTAGLSVSVAEFRCQATPDQVLNFYSGRLGDMGTLARKQDGDTTTLTLDLGEQGNANERAVAVKAGDDGTHYILVRVVGDKNGN